MEQRLRAGTGDVAAGILPAVEPGRPARRKNVGIDGSRWKFLNRRKVRAVLSGRRGRPPLHRLRREPLNTAAGISPSARARGCGLCAPRQIRFFLRFLFRRRVIEKCHEKSQSRICHSSFDCLRDPFVSSTSSAGKAARRKRLADATTHATENRQRKPFKSAGGGGRYQIAFGRQVE